MSPTYGEKRIESLLRKLTSKRKDYFFIPEASIATERSAYCNPDFVIVGAKLGVVVMEVKDWVEIKEAKRDQIIIIRRDGTKVNEKNPALIAKEYAYNLVEQFENIDMLLSKYKGKTKLGFPWAHAVAFPNISNEIVQDLRLHNIWGDALVFGKDDLTEINFEKIITNLRLKWTLEKPLNNDILSKIRAVLDPHIILNGSDTHPIGIETITQTQIIREPLKGLSNASQNKQILLSDDFLTQEAEEAIETAYVRLVRGVAGSGKSLVLARRAQYLSEKYPDSKILVMAFNKDLIHDLQKRVKGSPNMEINNFHSVCRNIVNRRLPYGSNIISISDWLENHSSHFLKSNRFSVDFVAQEIEWRKELEIYDSYEYMNVTREGRRKALGKEQRVVINQVFMNYQKAHHEQSLIDWSDLPRMALTELQQGHPLRNHYDIILIDEAQDFAPTWIAVVKKMLKSSGELFLCDDPAQSLFRAFSWRQKGVEVVGRTRVLRVPFRSTKEITVAAHSLMNADDILKSDELTQPDLTSYELSSGNRPTLTNCRELNQEIKLVEGLAVSFTANGIDPSQIAILCHNKRILKHWAYMRNQGFYVETFNKMKGLEFRVVLLPHLNTAFERYDMPKDEDFISETRRKIFTAMTRARENLIMSYHGALPYELEPIKKHVQLENGTIYGRVK